MNLPMTMLASLYVRFSNGRILHAFVDAETCLDSAVTVICSGAIYVGIDVASGRSFGPWQFQRNARVLPSKVKSLAKAGVR